MEFIYDKEMFITDVIGDDEIITIPDEAKGIRSFSFMDLEAHTIVFGRGKNLIIEESAFVGLKNLEIVKCELLTWGPLSHLLEAFTECPTDICFIVNNSKKSFINKYKGSFCLFTEEDANLDIGKIYQLEEYNDYIKIVGFQDKIYNNLYGNVYFPDYYLGKKLILDITNVSFCKELLKRTFRYTRYIKFPILVDNSSLEYQSSCKLNFNQSCSLKAIHLSRLGDRIPEGAFWEINAIESIYIPKNYFEVGGFCFCSNLKNIVFEDSREIQRIYSSAFFNTLIEQKTFQDNAIFCIDDLAISFNQKYNFKLDTFYLKEGIRVIADRFLYSTYLNLKGKEITFVLPDSVRFIGDEAFYSGNSKFLLGEGIEDIGEKAFAYEFWEGDDDPGKRVSWKNPEDEKLFDKECFEGICEMLPFK